MTWQATGNGTSAAPRRAARRPRRLALAAAALTATAAAAGFAFVQLTAPPDAAVPSPDGEALSPAQEILLAAATTAQRQPAATGGYWYLKEEITSDSFDLDGAENPQTLETWFAEDGREWTRNACCPDVYESSRLVPGFPLGRTSLTYAQLQDLPTDPEQLVTWIRDAVVQPEQYPTPRHPIRGPDEPVPADGSGPTDPALMEGEVALSLSDVLYRVPAPPAVRAAAFQALAALPEVTSLGATGGGEGLQIALEPPAADKFPDGQLPDGAGTITLVIDPATSKVLRVTTYADTTRILAAEWTDQGPPTE